MAAKHRAPDSPTDRVTSRGEARRGPKPGERERRTPSYKRTPVEIIERPRGGWPSERRSASAGGSRPARGGLSVRHKGPSAAERREARADRIGDAATTYANRQAYRYTTGKPSVTGRAASGAAAGAAAGTAVAGPAGTAAGAVIGGLGGGVAGAKAKREYKAAMRAEPGMRRLLVAEFAICAVVVALSPMTDDKRTEAPGVFMRRMTAVLGLFFILGLISAAGRGAGRAAAGVGGLVTVTLLVSERDLIAKLARVFNNRGGSPQSGTKPAEAIGDAAGAAAGGAGGTAVGGGLA